MRVCTKRQVTTSKNRVCEAALSGVVRPELRMVGKWLYTTQTHQISYHRQKVHCLKTRVGGNEAFSEMLRVIGAANCAAPVLDDPSTIASQYETNSIDNLSMMVAEPKAAAPQNTFQFVSDLDCAAAPVPHNWELTAAAQPAQLSKENHELVSYVLNVASEIEQKSEQVLEAVRIWNCWCRDNILSNERSAIEYILEGNHASHCPPHQFLGWKILSADRKRQRYTKKSVQQWMTYMSNKTKGVWAEEVTVKNFEEALTDGGLFCTIGGAKSESVFNLLGGRRNHFTSVASISLPLGSYEHTYNFRRYDTDLILPDEFLTCALPRVVVFECPELNLKAVMFIVRYPSAGAPSSAPVSVAPNTTRCGVDHSALIPGDTSTCVGVTPESEEVASANSGDSDDVFDKVPQLKREPTSDVEDPPEPALEWLGSVNYDDTAPWFDGNQCFAGASASIFDDNIFYQPLPPQKRQRTLGSAESTQVSNTEFRI